VRALSVVHRKLYGEAAMKAFAPVGAVNSNQ
jgi:hypothetical protein